MQISRYLSCLKFHLTRLPVCLYKQPLLVTVARGEDETQWMRRTGNGAEQAMEQGLPLAAWCVLACIIDSCWVLNCCSHTTADCGTFGLSKAAVFVQAQACEVEFQKVSRVLHVAVEFWDMANDEPCWGLRTSRWGVNTSLLPRTSPIML